MRFSRGAGALVITVLTSGCANFSADYQMTSSESFDAVDRLVIREGDGGGLGRISFTAGADGGFDLWRLVNRNDARGPEERLGQDGGTLTIDLDCPPVFGPGECFVDYDFTVPAGLHTEVETRGALVVDGVVGPLTVAGNDTVLVEVAPGSGPYAVRAEARGDGRAAVDVPESPTGVPIVITSSDDITVVSR